MLANHNLKICHTLVRRDFRLFRGKNLVLVLAMSLVTMLYAFVFLLGSSVEKSYLLNLQYTYGSVSQIVYTGLTWQQADLIAEQDAVKQTVRIRTIGKLTGSGIGQRQVRLAVADHAYAESTLSVPTTGRMPKQPGEIALDEFTLDSLGGLHKVGSKLSCVWTDAGGVQHQSEFTLCGWWASATNFTQACAWVTAETAQTLAPDYTQEDVSNVTLGANLHQPDHLNEQAEAILAQLGTETAAAEFTTNLAYDPVRLDLLKDKVRPYYIPVVFVMLCGYLMVYSMVQVTAGQDQRYIASLKSLGMTPRQTRRLLMEHGILTALLGLLPGWILGFLLHCLVTGRIIIGMEQNPAIYFLSWQPFVLSAVCMLLTVLLAQLLPIVRLSRMTPAQADRQVTNRVWRRKQRSDGRVTVARLALRTLGRDRWRTLVSAVSLLAAAALLNAVWIRYISPKEDRFLSSVSPWDYTMVDGSANTPLQQYNEKNQGITQTEVEEIKKRPEVQSVSTLKTREWKLEASDELRQRIVAFYNQPYDDTQTLRETQSGFPNWMKGLEDLEQEGEYMGLVIGMDGQYLDYVLEYCPFTSGSFDPDAFASGNYVLAAGAFWEGVSTPAAQETVELAGRTFTVLGSVMNDDSYLEGAVSEEAGFHISYLLPAEVFDQLFPGQGYRQLAVCINANGQEEFEAYLDTYEQGLNRGVGIRRRSEYQEQFASTRLNQVLPELVIGLVLAGIALMNFTNMLIIKTIRRKNEFAVYESLGMTHTQLRTLLVLEGWYHALVMIVVMVPVIIYFDRVVMRHTIEAMQSVSTVYTYSALPLWVFVLVLAILAAAVPLGCLHFITKGSLQERMGEISRVAAS